MGVSDWSGSLLEWENELSSLKERLGPVFRRRELRETGGAFIDGLLSGISRKTGWMMSEHAGLPGPWRMQALLGRSRWDADWLRDEIRGYVMESLGCEDGVLVVDDTGFLKKGSHSVGVVRQYSGTAGRIENCQVGRRPATAQRDTPASEPCREPGVRPITLKRHVEPQGNLRDHGKRVPGS